MIVLKAPQDMVLGVLQSIAGIVDRRHTLPIRANVLLRKTNASVLEQAVSLASSHFCVSRQLSVRVASLVGFGFAVPKVRPHGFFTANKANLHNAP